jgi:protein-disulfide isomerase
LDSPASQKKNRTRIITLVVIASLALGCLLILGSGYLLLRDRVAAWFAPAIENAPAATTVPAPVSRYPLANGNSIGDPNAPVQIVEYSDYQCPYCRRFALQTFPVILSTYIETGQVYFTYRSMGEFIGPESGQAAQAAYCAGDQGLFWDYVDLIWANQTGENVGAYTQANLLRMAEDLNLDMAAFRSCLASGKYAERAQQDMVDGFNAGVQGTPSFVINGQLAIEGAYPFEAFQQVIDSLLGGNQ